MCHSLQLSRLYVYLTFIKIKWISQNYVMKWTIFWKKIIDAKKWGLIKFFFSDTILSKVKLTTIVEGNPKAPFSIATTPMCRGGRYSFPGLLYFTLDPYLIMLSAKQGGIKYHFLSLCYNSTWDWTQVSRAIGEHSNP